MKQVLQNFKTGELTVEEVPKPQLRAGTVLVRNQHSLISSGTESGTVKLGKMSLAGKARARPEQVRKVINMIASDGILTAYRAASRSLDMPMVLGYACAGEAVEVGEGVRDLSKGDRLACGGGGMAVHAEYVVVPRNLCVRIPSGVDSRYAAFTTVGAISLQSVRVADVRLGDKVVVIGLGLLGLLTESLLRSAGAEVLGIDTEPSRVRFAEEKCSCQGIVRGDDGLVEKVLAFTDGKGADAVIITAAAPNNDPVALAGELARHKGKVVVVGRTEMKAPRETYLFKELELRTSLAYGPGTGDPAYEEKGHDYPFAYVRWTENRNMSAFLQQVASGRVALEALITHEFPLEEAPRAYNMVTGRTKEPFLAVVLKYPLESATGPPRHTLRSTPTEATEREVVRVGVLGAGSYATNFLIPILADQKKLELRGIVSASGVRAKALGDKYGFAYCASDPKEILEDDATDCVFILTRHDSHAAYTTAALRQGKHVFVEKPLAIGRGELVEVVRTQNASELEVMVGFNRPFAALSQRLSSFLRARSQPLSALYRANVGFRPTEHWLHDPKQGGGVLIGEACHYIDHCHQLVGAEPLEVRTWRFGGEESGVIPEDNFHIQIRFADGSIATIAYLSCGDPHAGRERLEVMAEGGFALLEDFRRLSLVRNGKKRTRRFRIKSDRGHAAEVHAFLESVRGRGPGRGIFHQHAISMLATLEAERSLETGESRSIHVNELFAGEEDKG